MDTVTSVDGPDKKPETTHRKVIVLGSGPAGYTAAIYAARANLEPLIITGPQKGGQLTTTTEVENFPGFSEGIDGNELMNQMEKQALRFDTDIVMGEITGVDLAQRPFTLYLGEKRYTCDSLIIATGASARYLGLESETRFKGRGVSACATCDGFFYKGQNVAVIGGGDTALEEASYLTHFCEKVFVVHRRDEFRAGKAMQERVFKNDKIEVVWDSVVEEVVGEEPQGMTDLNVKNVKTGEVKNLGVSGMFVAVGHSPNTALFEGVLDMDEKKYLVSKAGSSKTNIEGVFAAGDVIDSVYRQAVTAAGTGCMAAIDAERWLAEQDS
ncbi:MAG: thioredoxin-disulfide reductase [Proteobacteria bacterium]|nr:thioredoxin-disulfide reductase [Pseudomonadota bacterium]